MRVALIQLNSGTDPRLNLEKAAGLLERSLVHRPRVIVLPEYSNYLGGVETFAEAAEERQGPWFRMLSAFARERKVEIVAGLLVRHDRRRAANLAVHFQDDGSPGLEYRKIHLFDVDLEGGKRYRESAGLQAGTGVVTGSVAGEPSGLAVCYDLRFPELFRQLTFRGARVIYLPAAFTAPTGEAHWQVLLRARAIENQVFLAAADQVGPAGEGKRSWGHSLIADPWGRVLAEGPGPDDPEPEGVVAADLDFSVLEDVRRRVPCLAHRRPELCPPATR